MVTKEPFGNRLQILPSENNHWKNDIANNISAGQDDEKFMIHCLTFLLGKHLFVFFGGLRFWSPHNFLTQKLCFIAFDSEKFKSPSDIV
jgi:hypothetical protein